MYHSAWKGQAVLKGQRSSCFICYSPMANVVSHVYINYCFIVCPKGRYGDKCKHRCNRCLDRCDGVTGRCQNCTEEWAGEACDRRK